MSPQPILFTQSGLDNLKKEHENLLKKRPDIVAELARARDMGDRSENGAYKAARSTLSRLDSRIRYLRKALDKAKVVEPKKDGSIGIGNKIVIHDGDHTHKYTIVGVFESDVQAGKLSYKSPLGDALLHRRSGDRVALTLPSGSRTYLIETVK